MGTADQFKMAENEDITLFRDMLLRCLEKEVIPHYDQWEKEGWMPKETWLMLGAAGMLGPDMPEEFGAAGAPFEVALMILEETCRLNLHSLSTALNVHANIVMPYINNLGTAEQKAQWLPRMVTGEIVGSIGMTEPGAGSDLAGMRTNAVRNGDEWVINGSKTFITGGMRANWLSAAVRTGSAGADGVSMVLIPMDAEGVEVVRPMQVFGRDDAPHGHMHIKFHNVRVPENNLILGRGRGFEISQGRLGPGRIHHCMRSIGAAEKALDLMCKRAVSREAFGKPLAELGGNYDIIADSRIEIEMCRLLTFKTAWLMDTIGNKAARDAISQIKVAVPNMALRVIDRAIQMHGAAGISQDFPLAALWTSQRTLRLADGPDEVHRRVIARKELAKYT